MVRDVGARMLTILGYHVEFAEDGAEAIALYKHARESGEPFDAVVMDLTIPGGMGGKETIQKLREIDPDVRAIASSGYSTDPVMADYEEHGFAAVVPKPYQTHELGRAVHDVVADHSDAPAADSRTGVSTDVASRQPRKSG
jgi:two-component system cell cycle sensor histidine kinase/response regulator CckA